TSFSTGQTVAIKRAKQGSIQGFHHKNLIGLAGFCIDATRADAGDDGSPRRVMSTDYSFGAVMLELITGKPPIENGERIVHEVRLAIEKHDQDYYGLEDMIDPIIRNTANLMGFKRLICAISNGLCQRIRMATAEND
ncbi:putative leucine-rich repeat receptor-like protein kinase, partial [Ananas comosus]